ncbi:sensor histidine kinase [Faecalitalea cylindroides]|uniref:sensor histidine kinase n=1 Tax=Faecalitalea cylindroides TaxID=39483 RepID=UPI00232CA1CB|nr:ATP-binding protein [Faecalitalea cylindroides]MDB7952638.1 ATP-binding protein [Faecalitalea cylindroides]MDB7959294.1 ATP-binding protein [Faecalitalea cylindroides]MDB7961343.1 ATP-binding protein [Faecalitalea cylindroides]MDB7963376.1 ATP-binding protein [Faecalitalea cylindroides]MDB7964991.1 ATP-binding protein [Faecalitalea cylindroides]
MHHKIIRSFLIIFSLSFVIGFGILYGVLYYVSLNQQTSNLNDELSIIVQTNFEESQQIGEELFDKDTRLTMISSDGEVLYDNFDDSINENHLQREEIKEASKNGTGSSVRYSETMEQNYLYVAEYDAQEQTYVRLAMPFSGVSQSALMLLPSFFIAFVIAFFFVWLMSKRMADSILKPLQEISAVIRKADFGKEKIEFQNYSYSELQEITDALQTMNNQIAKNLENLEREKQIRQEFFTNASHELKTPLTSIRGYSELLRQHAITDPDQIDHCLDCVLKESDHMTKLINDILTISKLEAKDYVVQKSHIKLKDLLENVLNSLSVQAKAMNLDIDASCENVTVYANLDHIQGILYNLISNAIKYNKPNGKIIIIIKERLDNILIKVMDTGIGISKEDQEKVFQRFYRVDKQRSKIVAGTGIGLAIVKHIVQFYNGSISLKSKENEGTSIEISLPITVNEEPNNLD